MKNLVVILCMLCIFQQIIAMENKQKGSLVSKGESFLGKIKNGAQEKYLREQEDWENYYLKLRISTKKHARMLEYLEKKGINHLDVVTLEEQEWLKKLEEKNPRGFTAFLYFGAVAKSNQDSKTLAKSKHKTTKLIAHKICDECLNCILF
jgi:hypothetical protein